MLEESPQTRVKRPQGGGGIMVWGMVLPNGLVRVFKLTGRMDSAAYVSLIEQHAVPELNAQLRGSKVYFQQDNAPIHASRYTLPRLEGLG